MDTQTRRTYQSDMDDQSAIYVYNGGKLTMANAVVLTTGNTSSNDSSSFYGLNAAVLDAGGGSITMTDSKVTTGGSGANGVFSTGAGSLLSFSGGSIAATGNGAHAAMAIRGGAMILTDVDMDTSGAGASAIATDRRGRNLRPHHRRHHRRRAYGVLRRDASGQQLAGRQDLPARRRRQPDAGTVTILSIIMRSLKKPHALPIAID
jgi:hypothetical protein